MFMAIISKAIIIKPEKTAEFLSMPPRHEAMEKANQCMKKYGHKITRQYGGKRKNG